MMTPDAEMILNDFGYYEAKVKPNEEELAEYYNTAYYQNNAGCYQHAYGESDMQYMHEKFEEQYYVLAELAKTSGTMLDIGCGEGWNMRFFDEKKREVLGLDFSDFGLKTHNEHLANNIRVGNVYDHLDGLIEEGVFFEVIMMDNILEHVIDPEKVLRQVKKVLAPTGILIVEVPNDYSQLQMKALDDGLIDRKNRIYYPDHLSYFSRDGLNNLSTHCGLKNVYSLTNNMIDFNVLNEDTNYVMNKSVGKNCYIATKRLSALFHSVSLEQTVDLHRCLAEMGLGRQIIGFFTHED